MKICIQFDTDNERLNFCDLFLSACPKQIARLCTSSDVTELRFEI